VKALRSAAAAAETMEFLTQSWSGGMLCSSLPLPGIYIIFLLKRRKACILKILSLHFGHVELKKHSSKKCDLRIRLKNEVLVLYLF
jgi:hypothetical protein